MMTIKHSTSVFCYSVISLLLSAQVDAKPTEAVVNALSNSVLRVQVNLASGKQGFGSAVVVAKGEAVTSCHVVYDATDVTVEYNNEKHKVTAIKPDWRHDLCLLEIANLAAPSVKMGETEKLSYQDSVFTVGYPDGVKNPVNTYGMVEGLFPLDNSVVMRASSAFKLGASGGGAFDDAGQLIGVITVKSKGANAHFYYMPVEWVQALMQKQAVQLGGQFEKPFWAQANKPYFMQVVTPHMNADWHALMMLAKQWVTNEPAAAEAWFYLAVAEMAEKDLINAEMHLKQVLQLNKQHHQAAVYLAQIADKLHVNGQKVAYAN